MEYQKKSRECTLEDYYQLPDERRAELIDGVIYDMSAPTIIHQKISLEISVRFHAFISQKKGACMVFSAPVDVQLDCDEKTMVQPDVLVVCDREKNSSDTCVWSSGSDYGNLVPCYKKN